MESYRVKILSITDSPPGLKKVRFETTVKGIKVQLTCLSTKQALNGTIRQAILDHLKMAKENAEFAPAKEFTV